jgi:hypothetical protein
MPAVSAERALRLSGTAPTGSVVLRRIDDDGGSTRPMDVNDESALTMSSLGRLARRSLKRIRAADLFDAWMFAETEATLALAAWRSASRAEKADAYASYRAALDREAQAARTLELRLAPAT